MSTDTGTPRTDAVLCCYEEGKPAMWIDENIVCASFARDLERENADLRRQVTLVEESRKRIADELHEAATVIGRHQPQLCDEILWERDRLREEMTAALAREKRLREVADELAKAIPCDHALHLISKARALNAYHAALAFDGKEETPCS
jgi:hypothetical protein